MACEDFLIRRETDFRRTSVVLGQRLRDDKSEESFLNWYCGTKVPGNDYLLF